MSSDETGEFKRLYYFDLRCVVEVKNPQSSYLLILTSEETLPKVLTAGIPWDVDSLSLSPDGTFNNHEMACEVNLTSALLARSKAPLHHQRGRNVRCLRYEHIYLPIQAD